MVCSLTLINSILQASLTQAVPQVGLIVSLEDENHCIVYVQKVSFTNGSQLNCSFPLLIDNNMSASSG